MPSEYDISPNEDTDTILLPMTVGHIADMVTQGKLDRDVCLVVYLPVGSQLRTSVPIVVTHQNTKGGKVDGDTLRMVCSFIVTEKPEVTS